MQKQRTATSRSTRLRAYSAVIAALVLGACSLVEDPTPENILFRMNGEAGTEIQIVVSTDFVAGVDEFDVTHIQLFNADTITTVLPVDTVVSVAVPRRFFVEVIPAAPDTMQVHVEVDVDTRELYDRTGLVWQEVPFRFVYLFDQRVTQNINVLI
jgi:hypothetical protein